MIGFYRSNILSVSCSYLSVLDINLPLCIYITLYKYFKYQNGNYIHTKSNYVDTLYFTCYSIKLSVKLSDKLLLNYPTNSLSKTLVLNYHSPQPFILAPAHSFTLYFSISVSQFRSSYDS